MTYPETWPGTAIIKSQHTAFNWQAQPSQIPRDPTQGKRGPKATPKQATAFGMKDGVIPALSKKATKYQKTHGKPSHLPRPPNHGGAYSKAVKGGDPK